MLEALFDYQKQQHLRLLGSNDKYFPKEQPMKNLTQNTVKIFDIVTFYYGFFVVVY